MAAKSEHSLGRGFWRFRTGFAISALGDACSWVALTWWALHEIGVGPLGVLVAVTLTARLLLLPLTGAIADRVPRRRLIRGSYVLRGLSVSAMAAMAFSDRFELSWLVALLAVHAFGTALSQAASPAFLVDLVDPRTMAEAQRITATANAISEVAGGLVAAIAVASLGVGWTLVVDLVTYVVAAVLLPATRASGDATSGGLIADVSEGFAHVRRVPALVAVCALASGLNFFVAPVEVLFPAASESTAWLLGALRAAFGCGAVLGAMSLTALGKRLDAPRCVAAGVASVACGLGTFAWFGPSAGLLCVALAGCGIAIVNVTINTRIAECVPRPILARTFAILRFSTGLAGPLGVLIQGFIVARSGVLVASAIAGVGLASLAVWARIVPGLTDWLRWSDRDGIAGPDPLVTR